MSVKDILTQALKDLPDEATVDQFLQYVEAEAAKQAAIEGGATEEEADAAASKEAADVAATATPEETVELADAPKVEAMDEITSDETEPADAPTALANEFGFGSFEELSDALRANQEAVMAALQGAAPEEGGEMSALAKAKARAVDLSREVSQGKVEAGKLEERIRALEIDLKLSKAVGAGHILEAELEDWRELALEAPKHFDKRLAVAEKSPAVPAGSAYSRRPINADRRELSREQLVQVEIDELDERTRHFYRAAISGGASHEKALKTATETAAARA